MSSAHFRLACIWAWACSTGAVGTTTPDRARLPPERTTWPVWASGSTVWWVPLGSGATRSRSGAFWGRLMVRILPGVCVGWWGPRCPGAVTFPPPSGGCAPGAGGSGGQVPALGEQVGHALFHGFGAVGRVGVGAGGEPGGLRSGHQVGGVGGLDGAGDGDVAAAVIAQVDDDGVLGAQGAGAEAQCAALVQAPVQVVVACAGAGVGDDVQLHAFESGGQARGAVDGEGGERGVRSEERRVGKEWRSRGRTYAWTEKKGRTRGRQT